MSKPKLAGRMDLMEQEVHCLALQALSEQLESKRTLTARQMANMRSFGVEIADGMPLLGSTAPAAWSNQVKAPVQKFWKALDMWLDVDTNVR